MLSINKSLYKSQGYLILKNIVNKKILADLNNDADLMISNYKKGIYNNQAASAASKKDWKQKGDISQKGKMFLSNQCEFYPNIDKYAKGSIVKNIAKKILGKKVYLFNEQIVNKEPNTKSNFSWHQDSGYINFLHKPYLSIWLALGDTDENNGSLSVFPTNLNKIKTNKNHKWSNTTKDLVIKVNEKKAVSCPLEAGSALVFSSLTPHSSGANRTNRNRKGYLTQYSSEPLVNPVSGFAFSRTLLL